MEKSTVFQRSFFAVAFVTYNYFISCLYVPSIQLLMPTSRNLSVKANDLAHYLLGFV